MFFLKRERHLCYGGSDRLTSRTNHSITNTNLAGLVGKLEILIMGGYSILWQIVQNI
jgi:hypothetical protein